MYDTWITPHTLTDTTKGFSPRSGYGYTRLPDGEPCNAWRYRAPVAKDNQPARRQPERTAVRRAVAKAIAKTVKVPGAGGRMSCVADPLALQDMEMR